MRAKAARSSQPNLAEVGIEAKIENVEWAQWLSDVYKDKNYDLTIISHVEPLDIGIYANPGYYFNYDNTDFTRLIARLSTARRTSTPIRSRWARRSTSWRTIASTCSCSSCRMSSIADANLNGLWKDAPIFANDLSAMSWKCQSWN